VCAYPDLFSGGGIVFSEEQVEFAGPAERLTWLHHALLARLDTIGPADDPSTVLREFAAAHRVTAREVGELTSLHEALERTDSPDGRTYAPAVDKEPRTELTAEQREWAEPELSPDSGPDDASLPQHAPDAPTPDSDPPSHADPLVQRCLDELGDDWHRQGGRLDEDDVQREIDRRHLDAYQAAELLRMLEVAELYRAASVATDLDDDPRDTDRGHRGGDADSLGRYLAEVGRYKLLYAEDEVRLGRLIAAGQAAETALAAPTAAVQADHQAKLEQQVSAGKRAFDELVTANLRLVISVAKQRKYEGRGVELIDRIQDGNLGVMRAAEKFNHTLGYKFSTYATWWIRQSIDRGLADRGRLIRLPVHMSEQLSKIYGARRMLSEKLGRPPTLRELAIAVGDDPGRVQAVIDSERRTTSLDANLTEDGSFTLEDSLDASLYDPYAVDPATVVVDGLRDRDTRNVLFGILDARSAGVVLRRFGMSNDGEETLDAIGQSLGITRERVRQIAQKSMGRLASSPQILPLLHYIKDQSWDSKPARNESPPAPIREPARGIDDPDIERALREYQRRHRLVRERASAAPSTTKEGLTAP
jgi:RNA polymerase primary sigma factor